MLLQNGCLQQNAYFSNSGRSIVLDTEQRLLLPRLFLRLLERFVLCHTECASLHHRLDESSFNLLLINQAAKSRQRNTMLLLTL